MVIVRPHLYARDAGRPEPRDAEAQGNDHQRGTAQGAGAQRLGEQARGARGQDHERRNGGVEEPRPGKEAVGRPVQPVGADHSRHHADEQQIPARGTSQQEQRRHDRHEPRQRPLEQIAVEPHQVRRSESEGAQRRVGHAQRIHVKPQPLTGAIQRIVGEQERMSGGPGIDVQQPHHRQRARRDL